MVQHACCMQAAVVRAWCAGARLEGGIGDEQLRGDVGRKEHRGDKRVRRGHGARLAEVDLRRRGSTTHVTGRMRRQGWPLRCVQRTWR